MRDTRTPLRYAVIRVILTTVLGYFAAIVLPPMFGVPPLLGTAGLTASAGVAGWVEYLLLRRTLNARLGDTGLPVSLTIRLWAAAAAGAVVAWAIKIVMPPAPPILTAAIVLTPYGLTYLVMTLVLKVPEARRAVAKLRTRELKN
jgi:putative peptidoglycan lipid II flippase